MSSETSFLVVGLKDDAKKLFDKIDKTVSDVEKEVERKKQAVTDKKKLKSYELDLLRTDTSFQDRLKQKYPGLQFQIQDDHIMLHGAMDDILKFKVELSDFLHDIESDEVPVDTENKLNFLADQKTQQYVSKKLHEKSASIAWELNTRKRVVVMHAVKPECLSQAKEVIANAVCEEYIDVHPESCDLLVSEEWFQMVQKLIDTSGHGSLSITSDEHGGVLLVGTDNVITKAQTEVKKFLDLNTIYTEIVAFGPSTHKFIVRFLLIRIKDIERELQMHKIQITVEKQSNRIEVKGRSKGFEQAKTRLEAVGNSIICHQEVITDKASIAFLMDTPRCLEDLDGVASRMNCVFSLEPEEPGMKVKFSLIIIFIHLISLRNYHLE
jgi:hypothetical protein